VSLWSQSSRRFPFPSPLRLPSSPYIYSCPRRVPRLASLWSQTARKGGHTRRGCWWDLLRFFIFSPNNWVWVFCWGRLVTMPIGRIDDMGLDPYLSTSSVLKYKMF
jgi:hypothetical protein